MAATPGSRSVPGKFRRGKDPEDIALTWLDADDISDAVIDSVCLPTTGAAKVYYRRDYATWILLCTRHNGTTRVVETPLGIEGVVRLTQHEDGGWMVSGVQTILPPELFCGDVDLYVPGGARRYARILASSRPERFGLPRIPVW